VEFVIQGEKGVFPVEVKAGISFRTSLAEGHDGTEIKDIPLYAFGPAARVYTKTA